MELKTAYDRLKALSEMWEETEVWHNPPFMDGEIQITTGDLLAIHTILRELDTKEGIKIRLWEISENENE